MTLAPFAVLAADGATLRRPRPRLAPGRWPTGSCAADPAIFTPDPPPGRRPGRPGAEAAATDWWLALTAAGGEGMVVKPYAGLAGAADGAWSSRHQVPGPGVPADHLRAGLHRAGAARPRCATGGWAVSGAWRCASTPSGLAALDAVAEDAPLWRVHELVFAILACESEPVDPRL